MKGIKIGLSAFTWLVALVGIVVCALLIVRWDAAWDDMTAFYIMDNIPEVALPLGIGMIETYVLLVVAAAAMIIFMVVDALLKPKVGMRLGVGIVGILIVLLFSVYVLGDSSYDPKWADDPMTSGEVQWISGGLMMTLVLGLIAIVSLVLLEVKKIFG
ncbi:MAG: hypothetical protein HKN32_09280 [Flavobacteriales bacterium]|nr:hypothetical protein [Flavobacteriales bacterium]